MHRKATKRKEKYRLKRGDLNVTIRFNDFVLSRKLSQM